MVIEVMRQALLGMVMVTGGGPQPELGGEAAAAEAWTERFVDGGEGVRLLVRERGTGEAVVVLAGGPGFSGDYLCAMAGALAESSHVIVPDPRGTGRSELAEWDPAQVTMEKMVRDLETIRESLDIERWTVVGHSFGGIAAMAYAGAHPERVRAMVLIGPGGPTPEYASWLGENMVARLDAEHLALVEHWQEPTRFGADPARAIVELNFALAPAFTADPSVGDRLAREMLTPDTFNPNVTLAMQAWLRAGYDLRPALAAVECPVLIVQGRQDPLGERTLEMVRAALPQSRVEWIEDCGHWPFVEQEERFNALLRDVLSKPAD